MATDVVHLLLLFFICSPGTSMSECVANVLAVWEDD